MRKIKQTTGKYRTEEYRRVFLLRSRQELEENSSANMDNAGKTNKDNKQYRIQRSYKPTFLKSNILKFVILFEFKPAWIVHYQIYPCQYMGNVHRERRMV